MRNILLFKDLFFLRVSVVKRGNPYSTFNSHRSDEYILLNGISIEINKRTKEMYLDSSGRHWNANATKHKELNTK